MDHAILKKRLNTFRAGESGRLQEVADDVVIQTLRAWENWPGTTTDFCREIGIKPAQMNVIIRCGKKLIKSGVVTESEFKELGAVGGNTLAPVGPCTAIELSWEGGKVIRFPQVEQLLDFLKKAA